MREYWGYKFEWSDLHRSAEQLHPLMFTYDKLANDCLQQLNEISPVPHRDTTKTEGSTSKPAKRDLYILLEKHHDDDLKIKEFWNEINTVPDWVDWERIKRGQEVFYRYGMAVINVVRLEHFSVDSTCGLTSTPFIYSLLFRVYWAECLSPYCDTSNESELTIAAGGPDASSKP